MRSRIFALICALLITSVARADAPEGEWTVASTSIGNGNRFASVAAAGNLLMATGSVSDGQGGTKFAFKKSEDGGVSWSDLTVPSSGGLATIIYDLQLITPDLGYMVALEYSMMGILSGPFFKVTNRGATIEQVPVIFGEFPTCYRIHCLSAEKCWLNCQNKVYRTANGGESWESGDLPADEEALPGPIFFLNENEGWAARYQDETIQPQQQGEEAQYIVYDKGEILHTTDGGATWTSLVGGEHYTYSKLQFLTSQVGFLAAGDETRGYVMKTTNGGREWYTQPLPPTKSTPYGSADLFLIGGLNFFDAQRGWAVASYGTIDSGIGAPLSFYYTENGGGQWTEFPLYDASHQTRGGIIFSTAFLNEHLAYGVGDYLLTVKYSDGTFTPTDGDEDSDLPTDGDQTGDGEGAETEVDTGPVYDGSPKDPCPVPGADSTHDYPRCQANAGGEGLCLWKTPELSFCTSYCTKRDDCRFIDPNACCKPVLLEGREERVCLYEGADCVEQDPEWHGYSGALLGEPCRDKKHPDLPKCDPAWGGPFCVDELTGGSTFCSMECASSCSTALIEPGCCDGLSGDFHYCRFGLACLPPADGDEPVADGDQPADGDGDATLPTDGDGPAISDGDATGPGETSSGSSGGCRQGGVFSGVLLFWAAVLLWVRRRAAGRP